MHQQIRSTTAKSPPDLEAFLQVLADADPPITVVQVGGSDIELGGELAFSVSDADHERALSALAVAGYTTSVQVIEPIWVDLDDPFGLLQCIQTAKGRNTLTGQGIRDLAIGRARADGLVPVSVSFGARRDQSAEA